MKRGVLVGSKQKICTVDDRSGKITGSCRWGNSAGVIICKVRISRNKYRRDLYLGSTFRGTYYKRIFLWDSVFGRVSVMLSSKLSDAADIEAVLKIAVESMSRLLQANVGCVYVGEQAEPIYIQQLETEQLHRRITDVDEIRRKFTNLRTEYLENEENRSFPVNGQNGLLAVIVID